MRIITLLLVIASVVLADDISIINPTASGPMTFAAKKLEQILATQGHNVVTKYSSASNRGRTIEFSVDASLRLKPESYALSATDSLIRITGVDAKGAMYGALGLAEDFRNGLTWAQINNREEEPQLAFRAIKFNLPWDSYRKSEALSLHMDTVRDLKFWQKFLDMMAENRFNVLSLWNLHPFMYMVQPAGYPEVQEFTPAEMAEWQKFYHTLFAMCAERGIETYIVFWNIFVPPTFAKAHGVALDNLDHHFFGKADTSEIVKQYTHDVIKQTLEEYPNLTGIGFGLGEMMGGMTPTEREQWALDVIIPGVQSADRPAKLIHRVPFSANRGSGGSMNFATEKMTRHALDTIEGMDGPIWVEIKFNWSHAHSTPKLVKVHGGAIKDSYWNPMPKNYKITWMARNEDFFCLRWGEPDFIREHIRLNSKPYVGGYFVGSECYIPAKDFFTKLDAPVDWQYAFERQWLFYKEWGRLLYNPKTADDVFIDEFVHRFGDDGQRLFEAYKLASRMPLRLASFQDLAWDFTLYSEGFLAFWDGKTRFINVNRLIDNPPLDPDFLSIKEYVDLRLNKKEIPAGKITPLQLADDLVTDANRALELTEPIKTGGNATLMYETADVKIWSLLSLYFAEKIRGAVTLQMYRQTKNESHKIKSMQHLKTALAHWDKIVEITDPIYNDMPLVHLNNREDKIYHWRKFRGEAARDIKIVEMENGNGDQKEGR